MKVISAFLRPEEFRQRLEHLLSEAGVKEGELPVDDLYLQARAELAEEIRPAEPPVESPLGVSWSQPETFEPGEVPPWLDESVPIEEAMKALRGPEPEPEPEPVPTEPAWTPPPWLTGEWKPPAAEPAAPAPPTGEPGWTPPPWLAETPAAEPAAPAPPAGEPGWTPPSWLAETPAAEPAAPAPPGEEPGWTPPSWLAETPAVEPAAPAPPGEEPGWTPPSWLAETPAVEPAAPAPPGGEPGWTPPPWLAETPAAEPAAPAPPAGEPGWTPPPWLAETPAAEPAAPAPPTGELIPAEETAAAPLEKPIPAPVTPLAREQFEPLEPAILTARARLAPDVLQNYVESLLVEPNDYYARLIVASAYQEAGKYDLALEHYEIIIQSAPSLPEQVVTNLEDMVRRLPGSEPAHRLLGDAYLKQGRYDEATVQYNLALELQ